MQSRSAGKTNLHTYKIFGLDAWVDGGCRLKAEGWRLEQLEAGSNWKLLPSRGTMVPDGVSIKFFCHQKDMECGYIILQKICITHLTNWSQNVICQ